MNMLKTLVLTAWLLPVTVLAEQGDLPIRTSGFYLGAAVGSADAEIKTSLGSISGADTGFKFTAGYRWWNTFMPWDIDLGVEFSYLELGERDNTLSDGFVWELENQGLSAALVGFWPLTRHLDLIGKGGLIYSDTTLKSPEQNIPSGSSSDMELLLGIGIAWRMTGPFSAALEYERYSTLDGASLASLNAYYQFK